MTQYCGLCRVPIPDWDTHIKSEIHQSNLHNIKKLVATAKEGLPHVIKGILKQQILSAKN